MATSFMPKPKIVRTADTCFGKARIKDTRMPVFILLDAVANGLTIADGRAAGTLVLSSAA